MAGGEVDLTAPCAWIDKPQRGVEGHLISSVQVWTHAIEKFPLLLPIFWVAPVHLLDF